MVLAGAGLGGLARYVAGTWIMAKYGGRFPLGTLVINVTGSFLIAWAQPNKRAAHTMAPPAPIARRAEVPIIVNMKA